MVSVIHKNTARIFTVLALSAFLLMAAAPSPSHAADARIAVVDIEKLIGRSTASENIQKQLEKEKEKLQKSFAAEEKKLKDLESEIMAKKDGLSEDEFNAERQRFQKNLVEAQGSLGEQVDKVERAANEALGQLRQEIIKTIAEMTEKEQYTIVITKQNVIMAEKELDITDEVMAELNKKIKTIKLKL